MGTPSSVRTGPTWRMAGWNIRAKAKPTPASRTAGLHAGPVEVDLDAEGFEQVGGPRGGAGLAVAVLAHRRSGGGSHDRGHGRHVERLAARAADPPVPTMSTVAAGCRARARRRGQHGLDEPRDLVGRLSLGRSPIRNPAIWASVASPARIRSNAAEATSAGRSSPATSRARTPGHAPIAANAPTCLSPTRLSGPRRRRPRRRRPWRIPTRRAPAAGADAG